MPEIRITISEKNLALLEAVKTERGLSSRSKALDIMISQLFEEKDASNIKPEE